MNRNLKILNLSARGLTAHTHSELKHFLDNNNVDVICIQETKFKEAKTINIPGYTSEYKYHKSLLNIPCGGQVIFVKHGINYKNIIIDNVRDQNGATILEIQLIQIFFGQSPFYLFNIYSRGCDLTSLGHLDHYITKGDIVITGDFNAHNKLWGSSRTNSHGRAVEVWIEKHNLVLHNDGAPTRVDWCTGSHTCIDLTITSPKISSEIIWQVINDTWDSDHFPILITIQRNNQTITNNEETLLLL